MNILVITQYFYPETFRINDIVKELLNREHKVTVVTGLPNYPEGEVYDGYQNSYRKVEDYYGADIHRCNLRPRYKGSFNLVLNYYSFVKEAKKVLRKLKPEFDVIYVYEPSPVTQALPAIWFKKKNNIPIFYYCMDIWPESVRDFGNGKTISVLNPIYIVAKIISKYVYKHVDLIGNKCVGFSDYLNKVCKVKKDKMCVIPEHAEDTYLKINEKSINNGIVDFVFLGNIGYSQHCDIFVEAAQKLSGSFLIHFVGDGSALNELKEMVVNKQLNEKVVFHGRHPLDEIEQYYNLADVCLISLTLNTKSSLTPPGKMYGYMASARPVVGVLGSNEKELINEIGAGIITDDNLDNIVNAMQFCIDNPNELNKYGIKGREYFLNNYTLKNHVDNLESCLLSLIERNS